MAVFLIYNQTNNTYQEVLHLTCIIEATNKRGRYKFEKQMVSNGTYTPFVLKNSCVIPNIEEIQRLETIYKRKLRNWIEEDKEHKKKNHRAQTANYVLNVNGIEVFNSKNEFEKLWEVSDQQIRDKVEQIQFNVLENGTVYEGKVGDGHFV